MERLLKSRVAAARMTLRDIEDTAARAMVSNAQANAIVELAAHGQVVHHMTVGARASLVSIASDAPWSPGDLEKALDALTKTEKAVTEKPNVSRYSPQEFPLP